MTSNAEQKRPWWAQTETPEPLPKTASEGTFTKVSALTRSRSSSNLIGSPSALARLLFYFLDREGKGELKRDYLWEAVLPLLSLSVDVEEQPLFACLQTFWPKNEVPFEGFAELFPACVNKLSSLSGGDAISVLARIKALVANRQEGTNAMLHLMQKHSAELKAVAHGAKKQQKEMEKISHDLQRTRAVIIEYEIALRTLTKANLGLGEDVERILSTGRQLMTMEDTEFEAYIHIRGLAPSGSGTVGEAQDSELEALKKENEALRQRNQSLMARLSVQAKEAHNQARILEAGPNEPQFRRKLLRVHQGVIDYFCNAVDAFTDSLMKATQGGGGITALPWPNRQDWVDAGETSPELLGVVESFTKLAHTAWSTLTSTATAVIQMTTSRGTEGAESRQSNSRKSLFLLQPPQQHKLSGLSTAPESQCSSSRNSPLLEEESPVQFVSSEVRRDLLLGTEKVAAKSSQQRKEVTRGNSSNDNSNEGIQRGRTLERRTVATGQGQGSEKSHYLEAQRKQTADFAGSPHAPWPSPKQRECDDAYDFPSPKIITGLLARPPSAASSSQNDASPGSRTRRADPFSFMRTMVKDAMGESFVVSAVRVLNTVVDELQLYREASEADLAQQNQDIANESISANQSIKLPRKPTRSRSAAAEDSRFMEEPKLEKMERPPASSVILERKPPKRRRELSDSSALGDSRLDWVDPSNFEPDDDYSYSKRSTASTSYQLSASSYRGQYLGQGNSGEDFGDDDFTHPAVEHAPASETASGALHMLCGVVELALPLLRQLDMTEVVAAFLDSCGAQPTVLRELLQVTEKHYDVSTSTDDPPAEGPAPYPASQLSTQGLQEPQTPQTPFPAEIFAGEHNHALTYIPAEESSVNTTPGNLSANSAALGTPTSSKLVGVQSGTRRTSSGVTQHARADFSPGKTQTKVMPASLRETAPVPSEKLEQTVPAAVTLADNPQKICSDAEAQTEEVAEERGSSNKETPADQEAQDGNNIAQPGQRSQSQGSPKRLAAQCSSPQEPRSQIESETTEMHRWSVISNDKELCFRVMANAPSKQWVQTLGTLMDCLEEQLDAAEREPTVTEAIQQPVKRAMHILGLLRSAVVSAVPRKPSVSTAQKTVTVPVPVQMPPATVSAHIPTEATRKLETDTFSDQLPKKPAEPRPRRAKRKPPEPTDPKDHMVNEVANLSSERTYEPSLYERMQKRAVKQTWIHRVPLRTMEEVLGKDVSVSADHSRPGLLPHLPHPPKPGALSPRR